MLSQTPPTDHNCGFNCQTITAVPVTFNSLYFTPNTTATITGYSDLGHTAIDTQTVTVLGSQGGAPQKVVLNWADMEEISISGGGYYVNDIKVNDPGPSAAAAPEPAPLTLAGTGLIALAGAAKRKLRS